jgi:hypothetical protein
MSEKTAKTADKMMEVTLTIEVPCRDPRDAAIQFWRLVVQDRQSLAVNGLHFDVDRQDGEKSSTSSVELKSDDGFDALMAEQPEFPPAWADDVLSLLWEHEHISPKTLVAEFVKRRGLTGNKFRTHWNRLDSLIGCLTEMRDELAQQHNVAEPDRKADAEDAADEDSM